VESQKYCRPFVEAWRAVARGERLFAPQLPPATQLPPPCRADRGESRDRSLRERTQPRQYLRPILGGPRDLADRLQVENAFRGKPGGLVRESRKRGDKQTRDQIYQETEGHLRRHQQHESSDAARADRPRLAARGSSQSFQTARREHVT
jgi:hypothetical protein